MAGDAPWLMMVLPPTENELEATCQNPLLELRGILESAPVNLELSMAPKVYVPVAFALRSTENTGRANDAWIVWKNVFCLVGLTVFSVEKASPRRPSLLVSDTKDAETDVASSTACDVAVAPPITTVSVPTVPEAPDPSPYEIDQVDPARVLKLALLAGLKAV